MHKIEHNRNKIKEVYNINIDNEQNRNKMEDVCNSNNNTNNDKSEVCNNITVIKWTMLHLSHVKTSPHLSTIFLNLT